MLLPADLPAPQPKKTACTGRRPDLNYQTDAPDSHTENTPALAWAKNIPCGPGTEGTQPALSLVTDSYSPCSNQVTSSGVKTRSKAAALAAYSAPLAQPTNGKTTNGCANT